MKNIQVKLQGTVGAEEGSGCGEGIRLCAEKVTHISTKHLACKRVAVC